MGIVCGENLSKDRASRRQTLQEMFKGTLLVNSCGRSEGSRIFKEIWGCDATIIEDSADLMGNPGLR